VIGWRLLRCNLEVEESIKKLLERLQHSQSATPKSTLYAQQVEAKFKNARYSLCKLQELKQPVVAGDSINSSTLLDNVEMINFYCDCFWDFLRSSIDILAQLINELTSLGLNERAVDIKVVAQNLDPTSHPQLKTSVDYLLRTRAFKTLEDYRHCSIHRRQVYIETKEQEESILGTRGYYASTSETKKATYESHICCNPWDLTPVVNYSKTTDTFCQELLKKVESQMVAIINRLA
jgi:hypothetical protein